MLIISLTKILLLCQGCCYESVSFKLIPVGKERFAFTVNEFDALGGSGKDLPLPCFDWQDPFYKSEQLSTPVAALRESY